MKLVTEGFFFNNEKHEKTRKKFMEAALTARMRRYSHEIFSCHFVSFVVKKIPLSLGFTDVFPFELQKTEPLQTPENKPGVLHCILDETVKT